MRGSIEPKGIMFASWALQGRFQNFFQKFMDGFSLLLLGEEKALPGDIRHVVIEYGEELIFKVGPTSHELDVLELQHANEIFASVQSVKL